MSLNRDSQVLNILGSASENPKNQHLADAKMGETQNVD